MARNNEDVVGTIYLASGFTGKSEKSPTVKGIASMEGLGFTISLWKTEKDSTTGNGKPDKSVLKGKIQTGEGESIESVGWVKVYRNEKEGAWADFYGFIDVEEDATNLAGLRYRFNVQKHGKNGLLVGFVTLQEDENPKKGKPQVADDYDDIPF